MKRKRAMTTGHASEVKRTGHRNERDFAALIGGAVNVGSHVDKKEVTDSQNFSHSVRAGNFWQVFLYTDQERLREDFQGLGKVAKIMLKCIDAFPEDYTDYLYDEIGTKTRLQIHMRQLLEELQKPSIFPAFLKKALFGDSVDFLTIFPGPAKTDRNQKTFHVFHKDEVVAALVADVTLRNSEARRVGEMDALKVTLRSALHRKIIGEIEDRHDSEVHYRQMKFRLHGIPVFNLLANMNKTQLIKQVRPQILAHGKAAMMFN